MSEAFSRYSTSSRDLDRIRREAQESAMRSIEESFKGHDGDLFARLPKDFSRNLSDMIGKSFSNLQGEHGDKGQKGEEKTPDAIADPIALARQLRQQRVLDQKFALAGLPPPRTIKTDFEGVLPPGLRRFMESDADREAKGGGGGTGGRDPGGGGGGGSTRPPRRHPRDEDDFYVDDPDPRQFPNPGGGSPILRPAVPGEPAFRAPSYNTERGDNIFFKAGDKRFSTQKNPYQDPFQSQFDARSRIGRTPSF